jgi:hypothetical protein
VPNESLLLELNELRKENAELRDAVRRLSLVDRPAVADIASIESTYTFHGTYRVIGHTSRFDFQCTISWKNLFALVSPYLVEHPSDSIVQIKLAQSLLDRAGRSGHSVTIDDQEFKTASIQLEAYGLIETRYAKTTKGGMALFWSLTDRGKQLMVETRVVREKT